MRIGYVISGGIHLAAIGTFLIVSMTSTYYRSSTPVSITRQVSLVTSRELSGRRAPVVSSRDKNTKQVVKEEQAPDKNIKTAGNGSTAKSGTSTSKGGLSTGVVADIAFPYGFYLEMVEKKIEGLFAPPTRLPGLITEVHFVLQRDGRTKDVKVVKPSGNGLFDQAALRAVITANPLPPLPADFASSSLGVLYRFNSN